MLFWFILASVINQNKVVQALNLYQSRNISTEGVEIIVNREKIFHNGENTSSLGCRLRLSVALLQLNALAQRAEDDLNQG